MNSMDEFIRNVRNAIKKGLPGIEVQWMMASSDRMLKDFPRIPGPDARSAGVLILLWLDSRRIRTVFMQRPGYEGIHGGQISFPGGKMEKSDESIIHTALREAQEETGLDSAGINVIGTLTPLFIPVSNTVVTAVVGWIDQIPVFNPDPQEVDFLIESDLKTFLDPEIIKTVPMELRGETYDVRYFNCNGHVVWGATAMILNELLELFRRDQSLADLLL